MNKQQLNFRKLALPVMISTLVMSGCSSVSNKAETATTADSNAIIIEKNKQISSLEASLQEERAARSRLQQERESYSGVASAPTGTAPSAPELLPPNAKAGECYARVFTAPKYKTEKLTVLKKDASERIEITPARYETVKERVLIKEASERIQVVPATYTWVTEKVMVAPASERIEEVPAVYKTEYEKVLDKPEHTVWKKGTGPITKVNSATGEIMCLVTVPATYKTVAKRVLANKASTRAVSIPAKYKTIKKRVVKTPATTRTIKVPAEYKIVNTRKMVEPAKTKSIPINAEYTTVTKRFKVTEGKMDWAPVLCKTNMNPQVGMRLQKSLKAAGYNPGPLDGVIGAQTMSATKAYQKDKGLSTGGLTMETLSSLGVKMAQ